MTQHDIEAFVESLPNVVRTENQGYIFYFIGDYHMIPFVSIAYEDSDYDNVSNLAREGVFRVNIGISKETYDAMFTNSDPAQSIDYTVLNTFLPHPHYATHFYVCILNPEKENAELCKSLIREAHALEEKKAQLRQKNK